MRNAKINLSQSIPPGMKVLRRIFPKTVDMKNANKEQNIYSQPILISLSP